MIVDSTTDYSGQEIARILRTYPMPDFVKSASVDELRGNAPNQPTQYADPINRRYPINSPAAVCVSAAFLEENKHKFKSDDVARWRSRITKMARVYNVLPEVEKIQKAAESDPLADLPDDCFGLVFDDGVRVVRRYPLRNAEEVKEAARYFEQYRKDLPWPLRHKFASNILKAAEHTGADIGSYCNPVMRSAVKLACDKKALLRKIKEKIRQVKLHKAGSRWVKFLDGLYKDAEKLPDESEPVVPFTVITILDDIDREYGWWRPGGQLLEDEIIRGSAKEAVLKSFDVVENIPKGVGYSALEIIEKVPRDAIKNVLGDTLYQSVFNDRGQLDFVKLSHVLCDENKGRAFHDVVVNFGVKPHVQFSKRPVNLLEEMADEVEVYRSAKRLSRV